MNQDEMTLSEYCLDQASYADRFPEFVGAPREEELTKFVAHITKLLVEGRESFIGLDWSIEGPKFATIVSNLRDQFDWHITTSLLAKVPKFVERTMELSELIGQKQPSKRVAGHLREATRCYVFGFWQASTALSRAVVEAVLRERVFELFGQSPHTFGKLIDFSRSSGVLDGARFELATTVKVNGDTALHGGEIDAKGARESLDAARGVLEYLHD